MFNYILINNFKNNCFKMFVILEKKFHNIFIKAFGAIWRNMCNMAYFVHRSENRYGARNKENVMISVIVLSVSENEFDFPSILVSVNSFSFILFKHCMLNIGNVMIFARFG